MARKGINKAIVLGNLGKDPEIRYAANGNAIASFSIATSESWKDKNSGEKVEKTEWHRISAFGKLAEIIGEYLKKGSQVYIEVRCRCLVASRTEGSNPAHHLEQHHPQQFSQQMLILMTKYHFRRMI